MSLWLFGLFLALPCLGAPQRVEVHPLLLGSLSEAGSPIARELDARAAELVSLQARDAPVETLIQPLASLVGAGSLARVSAGVAARVLLEPQRAQALFEAHARLRRSPLGELWRRSLDNPGHPEAGVAAGDLARAAAEDELTGRYFDGGYEPSAELEGLELPQPRPGRPVNERDLWHDGGLLAPVGEGAFGRVYGHPAIPGAIIKVLFDFPGQLSAAESASFDAQTTRQIAEARASPRLLREARISSHPVLIKETVFGDTVADLIGERMFGPDEREFVDRLASRLAKVGLFPRDMRNCNVMIGHTWLDQARKAWLVDSGEIWRLTP